MRACQPNADVRPRRYARTAWLALLLLIAGAAALRGDISPGAQFRQLGQKLICTCGCQQGLLVCNHLHCSYRRQMKAELQQRIAAGGTGSLILQSFVQEYGAAVLAVPKHHGFELLAWILPWLAAGGGMLMLLLVIGYWSRRPAEAQIPPAALEQVRRELAEDDKS